MLLFSHFSLPYKCLIIIIIIFHTLLQTFAFHATLVLQHAILEELMYIYMVCSDNLIST